MTAATVAEFKKEVWTREGERPELRVYTGSELLDLDIPPRQVLMSARNGAAVLRRQDTWMIAGPRGSAKTWLGGSIAVAGATAGTVAHWRFPDPVTVLLTDGEMPGRALQERLRLLAGSADLSRLRVLAQDLQDPPLPSLATVEGQAAIEPHLPGVDLLILDSRATLLGDAEECDGDAWYPVQQWLLEQRRHGITTILIEHAGRNGLPRGTSRREDILDVVLLLKRPSDYKAEEGARVDLRWTKARGLTDDVVAPVELKLVVEDGRAEFVVREVGSRDYDQAVEMYLAGASPNDVAVDFGVSRATAYRWRMRAKAEGLLGGKR